MSNAGAASWAGLLGDFEVDLGAPASPTTTPVVDASAVLTTAGLDSFLKTVDDKPLTIVVNDPHRVTDTRAFLAAVLEKVDSIAPARTITIRMLVAAGTHKSDRMERSAHEERIAAPFLRRFSEIAWHDADAGDLVDIGGFDFHPWMAAGGAYLACGSLEPHYFAGVTGAHKTLTVGVMSRRAIETNHEGAMSPASGCLKLDGNPVHEGVLAALRALEASGARTFALNQVVVEGQVVAMTAGHPIKALEQGLPLVRKSFTHGIAKPLDLLVACVGPPLDRDFYQAEKGIKNSEHAVRDGGVILLDATCVRGIGIDHFLDLLRGAPTHRAALDVVAKRGYRLGDHKAVKLRALTDSRGVRVGVVTTGIDPAMAPILGVNVFTHREAAAAWARSLLPDSKAHALVVSDAGNLSVELRARS